MATKKKRARRRAERSEVIQSGSPPKLAPDARVEGEEVYVRLPVSPELVRLVKLAADLPRLIEAEIVRSLGPKKR